MNVYAVTLTLVTLQITGKIVSKRLAWNNAPIVAAVMMAVASIARVLASKIALSRAKTLTLIHWQQWLTLHLQSTSGTLMIGHFFQSCDTVS
jgi:hypothetical protein